MKISELIAQLQAMQDQHGDLNIEISDDDEMIEKRITYIEHYRSYAANPNGKETIDIHVGG